ncbi:hypothetical protein [Streptomyces sp. NPDC056672]|uniref:hypothetical protein n=1 Tax=Streptomyces sp. NPDC056672 TaxID=3345906 RepID=UPI0036A0F584
MDFQSAERASEAFQQSLTAEEIGKVCRRAIGETVTPASAVELGTGMYNNVYRVTLGEQQPDRTGPSPVAGPASWSEPPAFGAVRLCFPEF